jgi:hypothetical protein
VLKNIKIADMAESEPAAEPKKALAELITLG